jgi:hypothetical protein
VVTRGKVRSNVLGHIDTLAQRLREVAMSRGNTIAGRRELRGVGSALDTLAEVLTALDGATGVGDVHGDTLDVAEETCGAASENHGQDYDASPDSDVPVMGTRKRSIGYR